MSLPAVDMHRFGGCPHYLVLVDMRGLGFADDDGALDTAVVTPIGGGELDEDLVMFGKLPGAGDAAPVNRAAP